MLQSQPGLHLHLRYPTCHLTPVQVIVPSFSTSSCLASWLKSGYAFTTLFYHVNDIPLSNVHCWPTPPLRLASVRRLPRLPVFFHHFQPPTLHESTDAKGPVCRPLWLQCEDETRTVDGIERIYSLLRIGIGSELYSFTLLSPFTLSYYFRSLPPIFKALAFGLGARSCTQTS
jgi:hypothetical protein